MATQPARLRRLPPQAPGLADLGMHACAGRDGSQGASQPTVVAGPLCESGDVFTQGDGGVVLPRDLPAAQVTPAHLHQLYAQHLDELTQTAPPAPDVPVAAAPVPMQCR